MKNPSIPLIRLADNTLVEVHPASADADFTDDIYSINDNCSTLYQSNHLVDIVPTIAADSPTNPPIDPPQSVPAKVEQLTALLLNICQPIATTWQNVSFAAAVEQAEIELGLSFDPTGDLYIARSKSIAQFTVKLTLKPNMSIAQVSQAIDLAGCQDSIECQNSTEYQNSTECQDSINYQNSTECQDSTECQNSTEYQNSISNTATAPALDITADHRWVETQLARSLQATVEITSAPAPASTLVPLSPLDWLDFRRSVEQVCLLTDDGSLLTIALTQQLLQEGWQVVVLEFPGIDSAGLLPAQVPQVTLQDWSEAELEQCLLLIERQYGTMHSVIHLHPSRISGQLLDFETEQNILQQVVGLARFLRSSLRQDSDRPSFLTVVPVDQPFCPTVTLTQYLETGQATDRYFSYFVQRCQQECPDLFCRSIAWHTGGHSDAAATTDVTSIATLVLAELHDPNSLLTDVVYSSINGDRRRFTHRLKSNLGVTNLGATNLGATQGGTLQAAMLTRLQDATLKTHQIRRQLVLAASPILNDHVIGNNAVMPTVCAVNWIANASAQLYPGYQVLHCSDCKVFKGIVFDESLAPEYSLTLKEVQKSADAIELQGTIWSATQPGKPPRFHFSLQVTLQRQLPQPPLYPGFDRTQDPNLVDRSSPYDDGTLFHGPLFQGIRRVLNLTSEKVTMLCVMPVVTLEQRGQFPALAIDPIALDIQYQIMALWTRQFHQAACLPLSYQRSEHYRSIELAAPFYVSMDVQSATATKLIADLTAHDAEGKVYTKIVGAEVTISPQLNPLFFRQK